jgi:uncharacterized coiled-coil DUF342 family protein
MANQADTPSPTDNINDTLLRIREDLGAKSMEITNELEPLYAERDQLHNEAEKLRNQARQLTAEKIRPLEERLTPLRADHARIARTLPQGRGLGDNPA